MPHKTPLISSLSHLPALSIRRAAADDRGAVAHLAALDSAPEPQGDVLLAEVGGEPWAALSLESGHAVADPFRRSGDVVALLRARAAQERRPRRRRPVLIPRWA